MSRNGHAIAIADFPAVARAGRRTLVLRIALLAAVATLFVFAYLTSRGVGSEVGALLPSGTSPLVVLDISASISGLTNRRVLATLQTLADSAGTSGLIMFSDAAYELIPPGTPTRELRPMIRFFRPIGGTKEIPKYPRNPWQDTFQSGTRISAGLNLARTAFARSRVSNGAVILVSDLEDLENPSVLADSLQQLKRAGIGLRIVPLFPLAADLALWEQLAGKDAIAASPTLPNSPLEAAKQEAHPFVPGIPALLLALSGLLVLALATNERWCSRLALTGGDAA